MLRDVRTVAMHTRLEAAARVREARDVALPPLEYFNSQPCPAHQSIEAGQAEQCRACGVHLRRHQRVGISWLYLRGRGLIADQVGTGKTVQAAGLMALLKQSGELDGARVLVVLRPAALPQWAEELRRFVPGLAVITATGTVQQRIEALLSTWDVCLVGYQMFGGDHERFAHFPLRLLVIDDVDPLRSRGTRTAYAVKRLARRCERVVVLTASAVQKRLHEMHSMLEPVGGLEVLGSEAAFRRQFVREELVRLYSPGAGRLVNTRKVTGYRNLDQFVNLVRPLTLRRTPADIDDVDLPVISPHTVWLDLHPAQARRYSELRQGVLRVIKAQGTTIKHAKAAALFTYGQQVCDGLCTLGEPDRPASAVKLDWIDTALGGDLAEEKVIIFCGYTNTLAAMAARLERAGIGHVVIWGRQSSRTARHAAQTRFWDDPTCRVLLGTSAIEQSLNLQVSRHLICVDQVMNASRMQQLAGRIRRDGSRYRTVYVHNLMTRGTQEEGYLELLGREQALADYVWGESNQLFEALSPLAMLQLIGASRRTP